MALIAGGVSGSLAEVGVGASVPMHVNGRAVPYGALGHYRMASMTGKIAANLAASAQLYTFKWLHASYLAVIQRVTVRFQPLVLFTAAQLEDFGFDLKKATGVSAGGGGTALLPSKLRSTMAASQLSSGDVRIATTAALTALTTLDTNPIAASLGDTQRVNPAAATEEQYVNSPNLDYWPDVASGEHPLVLSANEGFVIANRTVWPAAGTGLLQVEVAWAEVTAY